MRIGFLGALVACSAGFAAPLDPEMQSPLTWRIVLNAETSDAIPAEFRKQFCRDLRMALATGFEKQLCRVEVIDLAEVAPDSWEPLWKEFQKRGWPALENDSARVLDGRKTHFVKLGFQNGTYRLEARQYDGFTGLISPHLASKETASPELVARLAGLMLAPEYGAVGTVAPNPTDSKSIRVRLRGGKIPGAEMLVQANDIFACSTVTENGSTRKGIARPYTYLRVLGPAVEGEVRCEVLSRYKQPLEERKDIVGFRCMKIAARTAPIRLKILDTDGNPAPANAPFELWADDSAFLADPTPRNRFDFQNNIFTSIRPLEKLACVVVKLGATRREAFVLPVGGPNDPPIELRLHLKPEDIARAEFDQSCEDLRRKVAQAALDQVELFRTLGQLIGDGKNEEALAKATAGQKSAEAKEVALRTELDLLRKDALASTEAAARLLAACDKQLSQLRTDRPKLETTIVDLKGAVAKANDPVRYEREFRAKELARQIEYHVGRGEIPTALELYDRLIELTQQADLTAKKTKLEAEWKPKDDAHSAARKVLFDQWRKAIAYDEFSTAVPKLKSMVEEFARHSDKHALKNFLASLPTATARLAELVGSLDESILANREMLTAIKQWNEDIRKADDAATAALK